MNAIEKLKRVIVHLLAENRLLRERYEEIMVTLNQFRQANAILQDRAAKAAATIQSQDTTIAQLQSQGSDYTEEATDALQAAASLDPSVNTDPTQLPDVDPNAPTTPTAGQ